jgi:hypothetical protein
MANRNPYGGPIPQHHEYAITGKANQDQDFGVLPHNHRNSSNPEPKIGRKSHLRDHERGIGPGLKPHPKRMPMQAAPDHGDHYE